MKRIMLLVVFASFIAFCNAQNNWPPIGAIWYYNYSPCDMGSCPGYEEYIYLEATKDSIINDTMCKKIEVTYYSFNGNIKNLGSEFIYSEHDKVYNYHHGHFYLMYDFSLEVGETINLLLGTNSNIHAVLDEDFENDSVWVKHSVIERDSIEVNGNKALFLKFDITDPFPDSPFGIIVLVTIK